MTIKTLSKLFAFTLPFTLLLLLAACGTDDTSDPTRLSPQAHKVTVTIGLDGSAATTIGSVDLDVILPAGFTLEIDSLGQPTANALTILVDGAELAEANYIPAANGINGEIIAALGKNSGFPGNADLMRISCIFPSDATLPTDINFSVTVVANDFAGAAIPGIAERISISTEVVPE